MENSFKVDEAIEYMKDKAVVTTGNSDNFSLIDGNVHYKFNGSSISISISDFKKLFKESIFSLVEDHSFVVDDLKDKEYYEKYKK